MANRLHVEIVTPERRLAKLEADEVIAPGAEGLFGVRPGHTPYLSVLQPGPLTVVEGTAKTVYFVAGGFVEAGPSQVRVLANAAEAQQDIDQSAAQKRLADAEAKLRALGPTDPAGQSLREAIHRERRRLEVATLK